VLDAAPRNVRPNLMEKLFTADELRNRFRSTSMSFAKDNTPASDLARRAGLPRPPARTCGAALDLPAGRDRAAIGDLDGYMIAYLKPRQVIKIIREGASPSKRIKAFKLTDLQAMAILNMPVRALRPPEGISRSRVEQKKLSGAQGLRALLKDETRQWAKSPGSPGDPAPSRRQTELGRRRT